MRTAGCGIMENRIQRPEVRSQKKRKSVDVVLSLIILDSGF
jgi:hypothetical protein